MSLSSVRLLGFLYFIAMLYIFLGISIVSDSFMGAIERITSRSKKILISDDKGHVSEHTYLVWNPTIANLSIMSLGSSAPEILLALTETIRHLN